MADMLATRTRAPRRTIDPVDLTAFTHQVERATGAFGADVTYSVLMARAAVAILRKRASWQSRKGRTTAPVVEAAP